MTFTITVADTGKLAGVTLARERFNQDIPQTIQVDGVDVPNPALIETDNDYVAYVLNSAMESWAKTYVAGYVPEAAPTEMTPEELIKMGEDAVQLRLDNFARERGYGSILSACTYVTSTSPRFAADGQKCVEVRDATWLACYEILGAVMAGARTMPSLSELMAELPVLAWPVEPV